MSLFRDGNSKVKNAVKAAPGPAERAARRKMLEAWIASDPETAGPLVARMNDGEITEDDLWSHTSEAVARTARQKRIRAWIAENPGLGGVAPPLFMQFEAGEISENDLRWLLGLEKEDKR